MNVVAIPIHRERVRRHAVPLGSGLFWGFVVSAVVVLWTLVPVGGLGYYTTPLAVRAYAPAHRLLKPSGPIGQTFGVLGTALMLVPFLYMVRKRYKRLSGAGTVKTWLEVHLFCGVVGPVLITLHTSFKFNGIISAAYWSMVIVMLSGFVGRYLYVRIPRSLRGTELTRAELDQAAGDLRDRVAASVPPQLAAELAAFEHSVVPAQETDLSFVDLLFGELIVGRRLRRFGRELERRGIDQEARRQIVQLTGERAVLLRRTAYLQRTKKLFNLWHVFHLPLVYLLLVIAAAHIAVVLYLGYVPFRW